MHGHDRYEAYGEGPLEVSSHRFNRNRRQRATKAEHIGKEPGIQQATHPHQLHLPRCLGVAVVQAPNGGRQSHADGPQRRKEEQVNEHAERLEVQVHGDSFIVLGTLRTTESKSLYHKKPKWPDTASSVG